MCRKQVLLGKMAAGQKRFFSQILICQNYAMEHQTNYCLWRDNENMNSWLQNVCQLVHRMLRDNFYFTVALLSTNNKIF